MLRSRTLRSAFAAVVATIACALPCQRAMADVAAMPEFAAPLREAAPTSLLPADLTSSFRFNDSISDPQRPGSFQAVGTLGGKPLFRAENLALSKNVFGISVRWNIRSPVAKGDVVLVRVAMRALKARQESGEAEGFIFYRRDGAAERNIQQFGVGPEWTVIQFPFVAIDGAEAGQGAVHISFGNLEQSIEISGLEALNFGQRVKLSDLPITRFSYVGREPGAPWREAALARIEAQRTSPLTVKVLDRDGRPVEGADVQVEMRQSAFLWGSAVDADRLLAEGPDADRYRQTVKSLFDTVVIENSLKWPRWRDPASRQRVMQSLDWLQAQGLRIKGHNLVWPAWKFSPADLAADPQRGEKLSGWIDGHIRDITLATRGKLIGWDVINEPIHETGYFEHLPRERAAHWFKLAQASDPALKLMLNDYGMLNRASSPLMIADLKAFARMLKAQGARVDVLGVQGHVGQTPRHPAAVLADLDLLASDGHQVQITEFDMNTPDEQLQADYTRDFLIAVYSHRATTGLFKWGFWQSAHWKPAAAMFRSDWQEKPNLQAWKDLVRGAWRTQATGHSDSAGAWAVRGHHGSYRVKAQLGTRSTEVDVELRPGGTVVELRLP
jgi:GH35 family endo-1,4-beta-xylanase